MRILLNLATAYGVVWAILALTKLSLGLTFGWVTLVVSPAIVASMFLVTALSPQDAEG
jgi:hypothetical protein